MPMNIREGFRRVAVVLAIAGGLFGCLLAYWEYEQQHERKMHEQEQSRRVLIELPDGTKVTVPRSNLEAAVNMGAKFVEEKPIPPEQPDYGEWAKLLLFPAVGFILPLGAFRLIVWVVTGFVQGRPSP